MLLRKIPDIGLWRFMNKQWMIHYIPNRRYRFTGETQEFDILSHNMQGHWIEAAVLTRSYNRFAEFLNFS